jgi:hypothetical protein
MEQRTLKVYFTGSAYYPKVHIIRDGIRTSYFANEHDIKRIDELFASHHGKTYVDFFASSVEIFIPKR